MVTIAYTNAIIMLVNWSKLHILAWATGKWIQSWSIHELRVKQDMRHHSEKWVCTTDCFARSAVATCM